jgi:hypothetical protein
MLCLVAGIAGRLHLDDEDHVTKLVHLGPGLIGRGRHVPRRAMASRPLAAGGVAGQRLDAASDVT